MHQRLDVSVRLTPSCVRRRDVRRSCRRPSRLESDCPVSRCHEVTASAGLSTRNPLRDLRKQSK